MSRIVPTLLAAMLLATPAFAQPAGGAAPLARAPGDWGDRRGAFTSLSPEGQRVMRDAMHGDKEVNRADRQRVRAARDRMLDVIAADRLDATALRRAMDEERDAVQAMKARQQASLLAALQTLTPADRRAFAADARDVRGRIEGRMAHSPRGGENPPPP